MSTKYVFFLFILFSLESFSQNFPLLKKLDSFDLAIRKEALRKDSIQKLMTENWDNRVYNPYKNVKTKFPFKLAFEDSTYASFILRKKVITSRFGWRWGRAHKGIDIDLITGDKVLAMLDGVVRYVGYHSGHGKSVIIRHYNGLETVYAHLSRYAVKANDTVKKGDVIGKGGTTGNARGSHIHLETMYKGNYINPEYLFSFDESNAIKRPSYWITREWVSPYLHNSRKKSKITYFDSYEKAIQYKENQKILYVVKKGDTLSEISRMYGISISRICKTNTIKKNGTLRIGQQLVL